MFSERRAHHLPEKKQAQLEGELVFIPGQLSPEQAERTLLEIETLLQDPGRFIDKGGAGAVFRLGNGVCIKRMEARRHSPHAHLFDLGNPVTQEAQFLADASRLEVGGGAYMSLLWISCVFAC